jgi:hypothetical protein
MNHAPKLLDLDWYLNAAKDHAGIPSDGKLALALGLAREAVSPWRLRRNWPDEDNMIRLCELAGVDPVQGLLDLARWRAKGKSADVWASIRMAMVASLAIAFCFNASVQDAQATETKLSRVVYIMDTARTVILRVASRLFLPVVFAPTAPS